MTFFSSKTSLTVEERLQKRQLIMRDSAALLTLFAIAVVLSLVTFFVFRSFSDHRRDLARRWLERGERALAEGHPGQAVEALRSALAYDAGRRGTEIELAEALAAAGRTREAIAYFNSLRESEPGNGLINLQLARLAAKQGEVDAAIDYYQTSLDGTWPGTGYVRRREVRLELTQYLIAQGRLDRARDQLITAAGNAPDDPGVLVQIAALMERAQDPFSALRVYGMALKHQPENALALEGAGRSAYALNHFAQAREFLRRALDPSRVHALTDAGRDRAMLKTSERILELYPSPRLKIRDRAARVLAIRQIAEARMRACTPAAGAGSADGNDAGAAAAAAVPGPLAALMARWRQEPARISRDRLERDPEFEEEEIQLIYDTEKVTSQTCGAPSGDDALLFKIAQAPDLVEQQ